MPMNWRQLVAVLSVVSVFVALVVSAVKKQSQVGGFQIQKTFGGNCVVAQSPTHPTLYCSSDITQVEDALRRYRQMPLGNKIEGDKSR